MRKALNMDQLDPRIQESLDELGKNLDALMNGPHTGADREIGFVLAIFPYYEIPAEGALGLISNGRDTDEMLPMLRKMVRRVERDMRKRKH